MSSLKYFFIPKHYFLNCVLGLCLTCLFFRLYKVVLNLIELESYPWNAYNFTTFCLIIECYLLQKPITLLIFLYFMPNIFLFWKLPIKSDTLFSLNIFSFIIMYMCWVGKVYLVPIYVTILFSNFGIIQY